MKLAFLIPLLGVVACSPFPKDASGTSEHIEQTDRMRVAVVTGTRNPAPARRMARDLAREYEADVVWSQGPASVLMRELEHREIDLVIGEFGRKSPVSKEASLSGAIGQPEPRDGMLPVLRFARKKGENRLITQSDMMVMR